MKQNKISLVLFFAIVLFSAPLRAETFVTESSGTPNAGVKPVNNQYDDNKRTDLYRGQSRAYEDANQEYAKMALYEYDKLTLVQEKFNQSENEQDPLKKAQLRAEILNEIKTHCPSSIQNDLEDCFVVYKGAVTQRLREVRKYNHRNSDMVAKLRMPLYQPNGGVALPTSVTQVPGIYVQQENKAKDAIVPDLKTVKETKLVAEKLKLNTTETFRKYAEEVTREPSREDFIKYKAIPRNPNAPEEGGKLYVLDTSCGKATCIDEKAYSAALAKYQRAEQIQTRLQYQRDVANISKSPSQNSLPVTLPVTQIQEDAYRSTRELMTRETNKMIRGKSESKEPVLKPGEEISVIKLPQAYEDREYRLTISPDLLSEKTLNQIENSNSPTEWFQKGEEQKVNPKK